MGSLMCMCACGHFSPANALFLLPTAAFAGWWSLHGAVALRAPLASLPVLCLGKTVTDTLWNGHDPLLPRATPQAPDYLLVQPSLAIGGTLVLLFVGSIVAMRRHRSRRASGVVPD